MNKEFNLSNSDAAEFLRDLADSIEKGKVALDGSDWKLYHEISENVPLRIYSDNQGTEIGFKMLRKDRNQT